jgi:hypothetical protein
MSDAALLDWLAEVSDNPLEFVLGAFEWGDQSLSNFEGPEEWQIDILERVRKGLPLEEAILLATASGHGVGKSALVSWLILWAISTREDTRGVVTANTETQLKTKTWAELGKWYNLFIGRSLFYLSATAIFSVDSARERTWRIDQVPWSERHTEAFAGLHNQGKRILVVFDEASAIPDLIWETTEGALTDANTQIIWAVFGNPTRNTGRFKACFDPGSYWGTKRVDSRTVSFTNKAQIERWVSAYGAESDFVKIRILGQFPAQGEMEFFTASEIDEAMVREVDSYGALTLGVDVARFGANFSVLFPRRGRDARTLSRQRYQGLSTVDLADRVWTFQQQHRPDGVLIDGGGVGGGVVDQVRARQLHCFEVQFGAKPTGLGYATDTQGEKYANKRAEMYGSLRSWIKTGALPNDPEIRKQLLSITYTLDRSDKILLTSKEVMMREGKPSPDDVDALACTFAFPVEARNPWAGQMPEKEMVESEYHPYANMDERSPMELIQ